MPLSIRLLNKQHGYNIFQHPTGKNYSPPFEQHDLTQAKNLIEVLPALANGWSYSCNSTANALGHFICHREQSLKH